VSLVLASVYSNSTKLTLSLKNVSVETVLSKIEDQSEFRFVFNEKDIDVNRKVDINFNGEQVENILNALFKGTGASFTVIDRQIIISSESTKLSVAETQQGKKVTGTVIDAQGEAIPGVSVVVKGTTTGTITGMDGKFTLDVPTSGKTLSFSFIGMKPTEVTIGTQTTFQITMETETIGIDEVVAIGYSSTSRKNVASSISKVTEKELVGMSISDTRQTSGKNGRCSGYKQWWRPGSRCTYYYPWYGYILKSRSIVCY
jgi:hypothetical protein